MEKTFDKILLYYLLIIFAVILSYISSKSFVDNKPSCNNFVINIYLYLAISVCIIGLFAYLLNYILFNNTSNFHKPLELAYIFNFINIPFYFLSIIFSLIFVILIALTPEFESHDVVYNHIIWVLFLFFTSIMLYPRFKDINSYRYIDDAILITSIIFLTMTGFYYLFSEFFINNHTAIGMGLIISLFFIIIIELLQLFFFSGPNYFDFMKLMSYIVIILFSVFISYDTSEMLIKEKLCTDLPNYPKFSLDFFLDILNLFSRALFLKSK